MPKRLIIHNRITRDKPKLSHEAVDYGPGKDETRCRNCTHFIAAGPACQLVVNPISPDGWCEKFQSKGQSHAS